ncbi:MAG TPA: hemerythrin family protein [Thermoanaerobaculia bacterium]|nr:hemerythrin family protein [Thermoanaerobaculia bacterium]
MTAPIGLDQVEAEHALQIELLRGIESALLGSQRETAMKLMEQLDQFSEAHFASEQILMRLHSYPRYLEHERQHGDLLDELGTLRERIAGSELVSLAQQAGSIRKWLTHHIGTSDRAFVVYLQEAAPAAIAAGPSPDA